MRSFVRITVLLWADILVAFALFVMQNYLTKVWNLSFTHAAGILNIWGGISMILPVFFLFLVDSYLGNFRMLVISSISYTLGIGFVAMSTPPVLSDCKKYEPKCIGDTQKALFYTGMALIAVGAAGNLVSVKPFLNEQDPSYDANAVGDNNVRQIDCMRIPGFIMVAIIPLVGAIALPYIKPWSLRFGIPAICTLVATLLFFTGSCIYNKEKPKGSPITSVCRVFVAAAFKKSQSFEGKQLLYEEESDSEPRGFSSTRFLSCLEKAAIILPDVSIEDQKKKRWRICTVTEVEDAKIAVRMIPMWMTFVVCGIVSSFGNTYFMEQANKMNRKIGSWKVPLQVLLLLSQWVKSFIFAEFAGCLLKKHKMYGPRIGIAVAMIFSILCCVTAAVVEICRLKVIRNHGLVDKNEDKIQIPMSVFSLLLQFFLLAGLDSFFEKSVAAFYEEQSPECMRNYLNYYSKGVSGLGFMCSVLLVYVVGKISEIGGKKNWFQLTLNKSRLDRYYWVLAVLSSVNLVVFVVVASHYRYRSREVLDEEGPARTRLGPVPAAPDADESKQCCCSCG